MFESYWEAQKQAALLSEAIDLALGIRHLTVVTGGHNGQVAQLLAAAQQGHHQAHMKMCHRGGDYVTFYLEPAEQAETPGAADEFVEDLATLAGTLNPGDWRILRSPRI